MSTPQPNAQTPYTVHIPPVISVPTTPIGAVQTMMSLLSPPVSSQGSPSPQSAPASPLGTSPSAHVSGYAPPAHAPPPAPATQIPADPADPGPASVSSHGGREHTPPRGTARVTRSYPALPELAHAPARPIPLPGGDGYRRSTGPYADSETAWQTRDDRAFRENTVGARLQPTVDVAEVECQKSAQTALMTEWLLNAAIGIQVLIGALTTALGAALSGKNTSVAISILGGASTLVASYLARSRGSNEPEASRSKASALKHFLREIKAFQLDHGHEVGREWDEQINGFRLGLESMLGSKPGSVTIKPDAAGPNSGEKGVDVANPIHGFNMAGKYPSSAPNPKLGFTAV